MRKKEKKLKSIIINLILELKKHEILTQCKWERELFMELLPACSVPIDKIDGKFA